MEVKSFFKKIFNKIGKVKKKTIVCDDASFIKLLNDIEDRLDIIRRNFKGEAIDDIYLYYDGRKLSFNDYYYDSKHNKADIIFGILLAPQNLVEGVEFKLEVCFRNKEKYLLASFKLKQLEGCCGVLVSYNSAVESRIRGFGIGTLLNELKIHIAHQYEYSILLCTDRLANKAQRVILEKNGWIDIYKFINKKTGNKIAITVKHL